MATSRFDTISKLFARRRAVTHLAQEATPTASTSDVEKIPYLFVQSFSGGTIAPKEGADGTFTVTLEHGLGQTLYFSDRPSRDAGTIPTAQFLEGLGFPNDNPPNAALVVDNGQGGTEIAVVELRNPLIDPTVPGVIYDLNVLEAWEDSTDLGLQDAPADLSNLPETLGPTHLFIDDCPNDGIACWKLGVGVLGYYANQGFCWNYGICVPCTPYGHANPYDGAAWDWWTDHCRSVDKSCDSTCRADPCSLVGPCREHQWTDM